MTDTNRFVVSDEDPAFDPADTDTTASPAEDFYRFVNGGWLDANPVPPEYGAWGAAHEVHVRNEGILHDLMLAAAADTDAAYGTPQAWVGTYWRSGMDTERIESLGTTPIEPWLRKIEAIASIDDLSEVVAEFHTTGIGAFFGSYVAPDFEDPTANLLWVGQGGLGLPDRDYYLRDDDTSTQLLEAYQQHVGAMFALLGDDPDDAAANAAVVLDVERSIAELSYTNVQMRDVDLITNKHATKDIDELMPRFGLSRYLDNIGAGGEAFVNIDNVGFYPGLDELIADRSIDDYKTYLRWHLVRSTASSLPTPFETEAFDFYGRTLGGQQEQKDRWKRVLGAAGGDIGELVSQIYVRDNFPPESKERVEHLVDRLFDAMRSTLGEVDWMSDTTREQALAKLNGFGYKIGYPDVWRDYTGLELDDEAWLGNRLACRRFEVARKIGQLGQPVDPHEWSMAPHVVNAYYHPLRNEVVFPAGMLQPPFFSADADDAVNYGGIGAVIGHEITHGFDDKGSMFDAEGQVRNWWTEEDRTEFDSRAEVMVDQFNGYEIEEGLTVNGELTLGENIADLGGIKIALAALLAELGGSQPIVGGLTPEQRFFMSYARVWRQNYTDEYLRLLVNSDPHSPSYLRAVAPLSNLASFAAAFDIDDDAPAMRPVDNRVDIW